MRRRAFIWTSILSGSIIAVSGILKWRKSRNSILITHPNILSHFCDEETIRALGLAFISKFPEENSKTRLSTMIASDIKPEMIESLDYMIDKDKLDKKIEQEYNANDTVILNGWILSKTEARQCALLTFTN